MVLPLADSGSYLWKVSMKTHHILIPVSLATLACAMSPQLLAQTQAAKTREQVRQELMEAVRTGNMPCNDDSGKLMREMYPSRYPQPPAVESKTREQVKQELDEAIRTGGIQCNNETGNFTAREINPSRYPPAPASPGKTREAVKKELQEAIRTGTMPKSSESTP